MLKKISLSEKGVLGAINKILKFPLRLSQTSLLKFQKDKEVSGLVTQIQKDGRSLMWPSELAQLIFCLRAVQKVNGDIAEVGVYKGASAKIISELKGQKVLHLFDTFAGLPDIHEKDEATLLSQQYAAGLEPVKQYLAGYKNIHFYPGLFPDTSGPVADKTFSFVNLDVDLYQPTLDGLKFFYPRMQKGGIILSHDYSTLKGVRAAFTEFFADKPEAVIELAITQCMIVKA